MAQKLNEPLHDDPLHAPIHAGPDFDSMTDEQILRLLAREESRDKFAVNDLEPDGMTYQWFRYDVFGKADNDRIAEAAQKGWRSVPAERHPGRFMAPDAKGPIILDGLMLHEMPKRVVGLKRRLESQIARAKVDDMNAQLSYAPPGTAPRGTNKYTGVIANREAGAMPLVVE